MGEGGGMVMVVGSVLSWLQRLMVQAPWREKLLAKAEETVFLCDPSGMVEDLNIVPLRHPEGLLLLSH